MMPYVVALVAGLAIGLAPVADRTLTEIGIDRNSVIEFRSSMHMMYLVAMTLAVILASGIYMFTNADEGNLLAFAVVVPAGFFGYYLFQMIDQDIKRRYRASSA